MDDIDRLTDKEIRQLFQLIKINADFPNTIYLLAFDRNIVEGALSSEQNKSGRAYLEKIIQVGLDVPKVDATIIHQYLENQLFHVLAPLPTDRWDKDRWGNLFHAGFKSFFKTLRDAKHFLGSFAFNLASVIDEVNLVDFVGIEALRVFAPEIYHEISVNKELFTQVAGFNLANQDESQNAEAYFDEIFGKAGVDEEAVKGICLQLFPRIGGAYNRNVYDGSWNKSWREARRICAPDVFDTYFMLGTPPGIVSRVELQQVIDNSEESAKLMAMFTLFTEEGKILSFLNQITDIINQLNVDQAKGLSRALLILGGELPNMQQRFLDLGSDFKIAISIFSLLEKLSEEERCDWFAEQIPTLHSLYSIVYIIEQDDPREGKERRVQLFSEECIGKLKKITVERLNVLANENQIIHQKHLPLVLLRWKLWSEDQKPIAALLDKAKADRTLVLDILAGFLYDERTQNIGDYVASTNQALNYKGLEEFLDPNILSKHISSLSEEEIEDLNDKHKIAIHAFLEAVKQKSNPQIDT